MKYGENGWNIAISMKNTNRNFLTISVWDYIKCSKLLINQTASCNLKYDNNGFYLDWSLTTRILSELVSFNIWQLTYYITFDKICYTVTMTSSLSYVFVVVVTSSSSFSSFFLLLLLIIIIITLFVRLFYVKYVMP